MGISTRATDSLRILADQSRSKMEIGGPSWKDIFDSSDIGAERNMIARRFVTEDVAVLDAGCGRGYFSFACAWKAKSVTSLDIMDGEARSGWWKEFKTTSMLLGIPERLNGIRATVNSLPFKKRSFELVASVHSIRNFASVSEIRGLLREAKMSLKKGGRLLVAESDLEGSENSSYKAFYSMRTRLGWELKLPSTLQMRHWLKSDGFSKISCESFETDLAYAPVDFPFDKMSMRRIEREYQQATKLLRDDEGQHPSIFFLTATLV